MASTSAPDGEQPPPPEQQRAPGLPRTEFIEDVGKFLEGETPEMRERKREAEAKGDGDDDDGGGNEESLNPLSPP